MRDHPAFIFSQFFGGQAAAIFLFLTGITFGLGMNRRDDFPAWERITGALRRARYLFLLAIAFRLQMWIFAWPHQPWTDLLHVDVLNADGRHGGAAVGDRRWRTGCSECDGPCSAGIVLSGAGSRNVWVAETSGVPGAVRDYFVPSGAAFSMFPWGSYLAFGLAAGSAIPFVRRSEWSRVMQWAALCGFGLLLAGRYFSNLPFSIYSNANFWLEQPGAGGVQAGDHAAARLGCISVDRIFQRRVELGAAAGDHFAGGVLGARGIAVRAVAFLL